MCVCIYIYIYIYIYGRPAWCCDMGADRTMITLVFVSDVFTNRLLKSTTIRFRQLARALHALLSVTLSYRSPYGTQRASCLDRAALNTRTRKMDSRIMHYIRGLAQGYTPERAYIAWVNWSLPGERRGDPKDFGEAKPQTRHRSSSPNSVPRVRLAFANLRRWHDRSHLVANVWATYASEVDRETPLC